MTVFDPGRVRELVASTIGSNAVRAPLDASDRVDGLLPHAVARPECAAEVAELLAMAARERLAVIPTAGGTKRTLGRPPERADLLLDLGKLRGITDWSPRDQVLICGPATALADTEAAVTADGQTLVGDWPIVDGGSLGGSTATRSDAFDRPRPSGPRWAVIGMKVAHPDGSITNHGARVAKNVAGLDIGKLHIGALGTLGVIVELTVRTRCAAAVEPARAEGEPLCDARIEIRVPPGALGAVLHEASDAMAGSNARLDVRASASTGVARIAMIGAEGADRTVLPEVLAMLLDRTRGAATEAGGCVLVLAAPSEWKRALDVWGEPPRSIAWMRKLKDLYDPERVLNPGRFVGGI